MTKYIQVLDIHRYEVYTSHTIPTYVYTLVVAYTEQPRGCIRCAHADAVAVMIIY